MVTALLEEALAKVRALPAEAQDHVAHPLLDYGGEDASPIPLTSDEVANITAAESEIERGEFTSTEDLRRISARYTA